MKLKENNGMSLIVFTIILAVLLIVAGGIIVYLLNNPVKEGTAIQTPTGVQTYIPNSENIIKNKDVLVNNETKVEIENKKDNEINIDKISSVLSKLDVIYGMEFTDYSKLSNKEIYFNLRLHLEKEGKISQTDSSNQKIKELAKEVFDKEYNGDYYSDYSNSDAGQGAFERKPVILGIEKENEKYTVTYTTITPPDDGDVADKVYVYYKAEIVKNAEGKLYIKSNTRIEEKIKDIK